MRNSPIHYIAPSAIFITPNANGSSRDLAVYVARGTRIKVCYRPIAALGYDKNADYKEWTLTGRNRRLESATKPYTIYARLNKDNQSDGYIVFAAQEYEEKDGKWHDPYLLSPNTSTTNTMNSIEGDDGRIYSWGPIPKRQAQNDRSDYWWIKLGVVSAPDTDGLRTVDLDTGILGTDQYNTEWYLDPDNLPLRIEVSCSIDGKEQGSTPYIHWNEIMLTSAALVEGWGINVSGMVRRWTIIRNTGNADSDNLWNYPDSEDAGDEGRENIPSESGARIMEGGVIELKHSSSGDDFAGTMATTFTITAWGQAENDESSSDSESDADGKANDGPRLVRLASTTITVLAETMEDFDIPINVYRWYKDGLTPLKPTSTVSEEPAIAEGDAASPDAYPTDKWAKAAPDRPATGEWALWMCFSIKHPAGNIDAWSGPVRISGTKGDAGEDGSDHEYIYIRQSAHPFSGEMPASINSGTIPNPDYDADNPDSLERISSSDKTKDDFVPDGWSDTALPATADERFVYMSIREKPAGNDSRWGEFSAPVLWSNWGVQGMDGDGVQYVYKLFGHLLTDDERTDNIPDVPVDANGEIIANANGEIIPAPSNPAPAGEDKNADWSDDPLSPAPSLPFCYCSVIKKINGSWGQFGKLGLWSVYSESGLTSDLDNEMDAFGTDSEGRVLTPQATVTHISMYYGTQRQTLTDLSAVVKRADTNDVVTTSDDRDSRKDVVEVTASGVNTDTGTVNVFIKQQSTVMLTYDLYVEIAATCATGTRTARFTLKHVSSGQPGISPTVYQLLPSMSSVTFHKDDAGTGYADTSRAITCGYTETTGTSTTPHPDAVSTGTYNIYYRKTTVSRYTKLTTDGLTVSLTDSFVEFILCTNSASSVASAGITGLIDRETVPVMRDGLDGNPGTSPILLDLDNEMDSIPCDSTGRVMARTTIVTNARIYRGSQQQSSGVTATAAILAGKSSGIPVVSNGIVAYSWTFNEGDILSEDRYHITLTVSYDGQPYTATFTVNVVKSGEPGVSPTIYQIHPTHDSINFGYDSDNTLTPGNITVGFAIWKIRGNEREIIPAADVLVSTPDIRIIFRMIKADGTYCYMNGNRIEAGSNDDGDRTNDWCWLHSQADGGTDNPLHTVTVDGSSAFAAMEVAILSVSPYHDRMNVTEDIILDRERIPILYDGTNGASSVRLALDNEHEDFLYDGATLVAPASGALSAIRLYDGSRDISDSMPTPTIFSVAGTTNDTSGAYISNKTLYVKTLTAVSCRVLVRCIYNGTAYYATFTANKTTQDKYDIIVSPSSIVYNSTTHASKTNAAVIQTVRLSASGIGIGGTTLSPSISTVANSGNLRVFWAYVNNSGTLGVKNRLTATSKAVTKNECENYIGIYFELRYYTDNSTTDNAASGTYRICDYETVEIAKVTDGKNGNDAHEVNPNILLRTVFDRGIDFVKEKWTASNWNYVRIDTASDTVINGRVSLRLNASTLSSIVDIYQDVYERIKPSTWYTLSFCYFTTAKFSTYIWDGANTYGVVDTAAGYYIDGVFNSGSLGIDGHHSWDAEWKGQRHSITFKTKSSLGLNAAIVLFRCNSGGQLVICMPKLEEGQVATAYLPHVDDLVGQNGEDGQDAPYDIITYARYNSRNSNTSTGAPSGISDTGWQSTAPSATFSYPYIWERSMHYMSDGTYNGTSYICLTGLQGLTGRMYYIAGKWDDSHTYTRTDKLCPIVYHVGTYNGQDVSWWYLDVDQNMGTKPASGGTVWLPVADFGVILTDAIFVKEYAQFGACIITGDWLISIHGKINETVYGGTVTAPEYYPSNSNTPAYTYFDPLFPMGDTTSVNLLAKPFKFSNVYRIAYTGYSGMRDYQYMDERYKLYAGHTYFIEVTIQMADSRCVGFVNLNNSTNNNIVRIASNKTTEITVSMSVDISQTDDYYYGHVVVYSGAVAPLESNGNMWTYPLRPDLQENKSQIQAWLNQEDTVTLYSRSSSQPARPANGTMANGSYNGSQTDWRNSPVNGSGYLWVSFAKIPSGVNKEATLSAIRITDNTSSSSRRAKFVPNYAVDLRTGKSYQNDAYIRGEIHATSGEFTGTVNANDGRIGDALIKKDSGISFLLSNLLCLQDKSSNGTLNGDIYSMNAKDSYVQIAKSSITTVWLPQQPYGGTFVIVYNKNSAAITVHSRTGNFIGESTSDHTLAAGDVFVGFFVGDNGFGTSRRCAIIRG